MTDQFNRPAVPVETSIPVPAGAPRMPRRKPRTASLGAGPADRSASGQSSAGFLSSLKSLFRRRAASAARAATPRLDPVDCTVFAPPVIAPGQMIQVQVYAYRPEQGANAASRAPAPAGFRRLEIDVERGAELRFRLEAPGLVVDQPAQRLIWAGSPMSAQFGVAAPGTIAGGAVSGTMRVDLDTVPIGIIEFKLDVLASSGAGSPAPSEPRGDVAYPFRKTFVSYATSDRIEVRRRVQMLAQLQIAVFWDVLNLDPQERWEKGLHHHIDECDLFLVFWSSAARRSEWVLKEVRYALERARKDAFGRPDVRPVLLEGPPFVEPPPDLTHLHFDDGLRYFAR